MDTIVVITQAQIDGLSARLKEANEANRRFHAIGDAATADRWAGFAYGLIAFSRAIGVRLDATGGVK